MPQSRRIAPPKKAVARRSRRPPAIRRCDALVFAPPSFTSQATIPGWTHPSAPAEKLYSFGAKWRDNPQAVQDRYSDRVASKGFVYGGYSRPDLAGQGNLEGLQSLISSVLGPTPPSNVQGDVHVSFDLSGSAPGLFVMVGKTA